MVKTDGGLTESFGGEVKGDDADDDDAEDDDDDEGNNDDDGE